MKTLKMVYIQKNLKKEIELIFFSLESEWTFLMNRNRKKESMLFYESDLRKQKTPTSCPLTQSI